MRGRLLPSSLTAFHAFRPVTVSRNYPKSAIMATNSAPAATPEVSRGLFIVVEGLDKAGKSTQCLKLSKNLELEGKRNEVIRFPG
jgi:hypothetical protein